MKIRVYYEDTDAGGIVYHANYIKFCERARSEAFFEAGVNFSEDSYFVVSDIVAKFIRPARLGDLLEVRTNVAEIGRASLVLRQEIWRVGVLNEPCKAEQIFSADIKVAHLSHGKPARLEQGLRDLFEAKLSS